MLLKKINSPEDIKFLNFDPLMQLCKELRKDIINVTSKNGGHLGSSLNTVELTVALHYVFDAPKDKIVWDIGHQAYFHKTLTGRNDKFATLRKEKGISASTKRGKSYYDAFSAAHTSTPIPAVLGMKVAKNSQNQTPKVVSIIEDGVLNSGMAYEALSNTGYLKNNFIVILNNNEMSISPYSILEIIKQILNFSNLTSSNTHTASQEYEQNFNADVAQG